MEYEILVHFRTGLPVTYIVKLARNAKDAFMQVLSRLDSIEATNLKSMEVVRIVR